MMIGLINASLEETIMMSIGGGIHHFALSATAAALFCVVPQAHAFSVSITVDENGNGVATNTNGFFSLLPSSLIPSESRGAPHRAQLRLAQPSRTGSRRCQAH